MKDTTQRVLRYMLVALAATVVLLMLFLNRNLAALAEWLYPGAGLWTHLCLAAAEAIAIARLWRGIFGGRPHLLLMEGDSPEAERRFAMELTSRMRKNPYILEAGITPEDENGTPDSAYLDRCLALLKSKADAEIDRSARRIFLATALSQNGRLDALIVFFSLCGLVWRVSTLYNQQPHPREIISLYRSVICSAFLAFSLEELDISTEISIGFGEAIHAVAPAGLTAGIPFAGKALQALSASVIDGAANCYLALRAGIITRNAYAYGARKAEKPTRAAVFKEAGALLFGMSNAIVDKVASTLAANLVGVARMAGDKTLRVGKGLVEGIGKVGQEFGASTSILAADKGGGGQAADGASPAGATAEPVRVRFSNPFTRRKPKQE
jgi:hypothetical protein